MTDTERVLLRLHRQVLQCYEYLLYAMLIALAGGVVLASSPSAAQVEAAQCGNIQSSPPVISR